MYDYAIKQCTTAGERAEVKPVEEAPIAWGLLVQREGKVFPTNGFLLLTSKRF